MHIYRSEGNQALKLWEEAIRLAPNEVVLYENVYQAYFHLGARKTRLAGVGERLMALGRSRLAMAKDARRRGDFALASYIYRTDIAELRKKVAQLSNPQRGAKKKKRGTKKKGPTAKKGKKQPIDQAQAGGKGPPQTKTPDKNQTQNQPKGDSKVPESSPSQNTGLAKDQTKSDAIPNDKAKAKDKPTGKGKKGKGGKGKGKGKGKGGQKTKRKLAHLRQLARYSQRLAAVYNLQGQTQTAAGNLKGAESSFEKSLELQISRKSVLEDITDILVEEKNYSLAREYASLAYTGPGQLLPSQPMKGAQTKGKKQKGSPPNLQIKNEPSGRLLRLYAYIEFRLGSFSSAGYLYNTILKRKPASVYSDAEFWREYYWFCLHTAEKDRQKEVESLLSGSSISVKVDYKLLAAQYKELREKEGRELTVKVLNLPQVKKKKDAPELQRIPNAQGLVGEVNPIGKRLIKKK